MKNAIGQLREWQQALADRRIPDLLAYGLSVFSMILGLAMIMVPAQFNGSVNGTLAFSWAIPQAWGTGFMISGFMLGIGFWRDRVSGAAAAAVLTGMFCLFGILSGEAPLHQVAGGIWSGPIIYTYAAWTSALTVLACQSNIGKKDRL